jgi:hypothetical protein
MRNWLLATTAVASVAAAVAAGFFLAPGAGAHAVAAARQDDGPKQAQLPLSQVVLFSSGVGYFQREGQVTDDARVDLSFDVRDINDLIKSMVLRDLDKGHVTAVSYDNNAPIERTLKSYAIDLTGNPTLADVLNKARGEKVEVVLSAPQAGQGATATGSVIGVEKQKVAVAGGKDPVEVSVLNLWCSDGIKAFRLPEIQRVRFTNSAMESEFKKALETLASSHDTAKKAVSIRCVGEGKRRVQVSYVVENPVWKTSYRLVLGTKKQEKPYLQGWAVVENASDEDWKDVRMALVSGRPISFQMDLYTPLYVQRPTVQLELFQSLRPVAYSGRMDDEKWRHAAEMKDSEREEEYLGKKNKDMDKALSARFRAGASKRLDDKKESGYDAETYKRLNERLDLGSSVSSAATAAKLGDFFQYAIDKAVSLPRQKSALLPILGKDVQASRVSIYREATQKKFPLLGLKLKNTSGAHLMQGPITIFEGSNYAGDAVIQDLQPNEERLLSYAIDLGTEVDAAPAQSNGRMTHVKAVKGVLHTKTLIKESRLYTIKNRNDSERTVLVEHPIRHDFKLVESKPSETASDVYRFELKVPAGQTKTLTVSEERVLQESVAVSNQSDESIRSFLAQTVVGDEVKKGLREALALRVALHKTTREIGEAQRQLEAITKDQERLRANLRETPSDTDLHKRYLKKLGEQETQIEKYQSEIKELQGVEHKQKKEFDDFMINFSAE